MNTLANHRPHVVRNHDVAKTRRGALHRSAPPGSKTLRRFYKAKHDLRAGAAAAMEWYAGYLADKDRLAREREQKQRAAKALRRQAAK